MATAMTYNSLVEDIKTYAERSDQPFLSQIPRFIMLAENRLASEIRNLGYVRVVSGTMVGNTLPKPDRWRETKSLSITVPNSGIAYLQSRSYQYCREFCPDPSVTGAPRYYADYGYEHFLFVPTPDTNYSFELLYYERPEPLSSVNQTNWTTQYAPQLLLYATMLEAMPFLKTSERIPEFQGLFDRAAQALTGEEQKRLGPDAAAVRS